MRLRLVDPSLVTALKLTRKPVKLQRENLAEFAGEIRVKEIRRREKVGLFRQLHIVMKEREEGVR